MKDNVCPHCKAVNQHFGFQCHTQRKPIKKKGTPVGDFIMTSNKTRTATKTAKQGKTLKELKELAQIVVNRFIRKKYANYDGTTKCYTCHRWVSSKEVDASHFISVKHQATRYDLNNLRSCCIQCNRINYGELETYRSYLVGEIGESAVYELEMRSREIKKWTKEELLEIIDKYK